MVSSDMDLLNLAVVLESVVHVGLIASAALECSITEFA